MLLEGTYYTPRSDVPPPPPPQSLVSLRCPSAAYWTSGKAERSGRRRAASDIAGSVWFSTAGRWREADRTCSMLDSVFALTFALIALTSLL